MPSRVAVYLALMTIIITVINAAMHHKLGLGLELAAREIVGQLEPRTH